MSIREIEKINNIEFLFQNVHPVTLKFVLFQIFAIFLFYIISYALVI